MGFRNAFPPHFSPYFNLKNSRKLFLHIRTQDQDGATAWAPLDQPQYVGRSLLRPIDSASYEVASTFDEFKKKILNVDGFNEIKSGISCTTVFFCAVLCCVVLCCIVLCCAVLCCVVLCRDIIYYPIRCFINITEI